MKSKLANQKFLKPMLAIITATFWISASEFIRNQIIFKSFWTEHFTNLGLVFPEKMINGLLWGVWSLGFAILIYTLATRFSLVQTIVISWFCGFVLMWIVIGNLSVLPIKLLIPAIPLSILETFVAALIIDKFQNHTEK